LKEIDEVYKKSKKVRKEIEKQKIEREKEKTR